MTKATIRDVMSSGVWSVREDTPVKDVARILAGRQVSAVPVVGDDQQVIGIVSEADLLRRRLGVPGRRPWRPWRTARPRQARDLMRAPAITVEVNAPLAEGVRLMLRRGVTRLPVVDRYGKLAGIVSRSDLVRLFARPDEDLRAEIATEVLAGDLAAVVSPGDVTVGVLDGVVTLSGRVERRTLVPILVSLARRVPGVVEVVDRLDYTVDDTHSGHTGFFR